MRRPLRPLARILAARTAGDDPDAIEAEARAARRRDAEPAERERAEARLTLLAVAFVLAFGSIAGKMALIAAEPAAEPRARASANRIVNQRADIVDREGRVLATNLITTSLYAHPHEIVDAAGAAAGLAALFPELDEADLLRRLSNPDRRFLWIRRKLSPEQRQAVHDMGEPGLHFGPREIRLYPNGSLAAHVLGGSRFGDEGVHAAEIIGTAGVEHWFDDYLRDPAQNGAPLQLSLDVSVQAAMRDVLAGGVALMNAKGASAVLMDAATGEIVSMVSLPDFDPNHRPPPPTEGFSEDYPIFNRAAQGTYELGSTFKIFTVAQALESGAAGPDTMINTQGPFRRGGFTISDFRNYGPELSVTDVIVKSSNIGTARLALGAGSTAQREFLGRLGLLETAPVELPEAARERPQLPPNWTDISTMTISYGHGIAVTPVHLAAAYASVLNGGRRVEPTLVLGAGEPGERVISEGTSIALRRMLRAVVERGTASMAEVDGYEVGGKTGTADKPRRDGRGYETDKVIAVFAGAFPMDDPRYVLVVALDEPETMIGGEARRTAGYTAVPVAAEIVRRIAPILNLRPAWAGREAEMPSLTAAAFR